MIVMLDVLVKNLFVTVERSTADTEMGPTIVVALPTDVTGPVRLAFVVTLPAVRPAAVPVKAAPLPKKPDAVTDACPTKFPLAPERVIDDPLAITKAPFVVKVLTVAPDPNTAVADWTP